MSLDLNKIAKINQNLSPGQKEAIKHLFFESDSTLSPYQLEAIRYILSEEVINVNKKKLTTIEWITKVNEKILENERILQQSNSILNDNEVQISNGKEYEANNLSQPIHSSQSKKKKLKLLKQIISQTQSLK